MTNRIDEMSALQCLGAELDPPDATSPQHVRARVLAGTRDRRRLPRIPTAVWRPVVASAAAAAVVVSVGLWAVSHPDRAGPASALHPAPRSTQAAVVLHNAALAALRTGEPEPRPDQLIYTESLSKGPEGTDTRAIWLSVDGTRDGLVRQNTVRDGAEERPIFGCRNGIRVGWKQGNPKKTYTESCTPMPGWQTNLPTDAAAMRRYLYGQNASTARIQPPAEQAPRRPGELTMDDQAWNHAHRLMSEQFLPARVRAALFEAMSTIPGATVKPGVVDAVGRPGVAVERTNHFVPTYGSATWQLIFDAKTYAILGYSYQVSTLACCGGTAYVRSGIVDKVGQLP